MLDSVFDNNVNNPGRGINVAIYDVDTSTVVQTKRYDTYESLEGKSFLCLSDLTQYYVGLLCILFSKCNLILLLTCK
jgi:hypothetical protein